ncbi:MAG: tRNA pseudouridine(55) synthase TruB [Actinomycetes bacterium]
MDGFLLVNKAGGMTSHDVVAMARKRLNTKRVGHAGTLDPMATGVLVLGVGVATKLLPYITDGKKAYEASISLGKATHTDDKEGEVISTADTSAITDQQIKSELAKFVGKIKQKPSSVSAIKIDGKAAHQRVREGEVVDLPARDVEIFNLEINEIRHLPDAIEVDVEVNCSAGTYIRAIARDLGNELKVGGHLTALHRTLVSPFDISECAPIADAQLIDTAQSIGKIFPIRKLDLAEIREIGFGRAISQSPDQGISAAIDNQDRFYALLENKQQGGAVVAAPILVNASVKE